MSFKLSKLDVLELWREEEFETDCGHKLVMEDEEEFRQDGKYQHKDIIFKCLTDGKFYIATITRNGSPFTDWDYDTYGEADIYEVKEVAVTTYKWVNVK